MSAPIKTKEELTRLAWLTELRRQGHRQCEGSYFKPERRVCALGLLLEVAVDSRDHSNPFWDDAENVGELAGLNDDQSHDIVHMNDGIGLWRPHTFAEIADVVEGWFAP